MRQIKLTVYAGESQRTGATSSCSSTSAGPLPVPAAGASFHRIRRSPPDHRSRVGATPRLAIRTFSGSCERMEQASSARRLRVSATRAWRVGHDRVGVRHQPHHRHFETDKSVNANRSRYSVIHVWARPCSGRRRRITHRRRLFELCREMGSARAPRLRARRSTTWQELPMAVRQFQKWPGRWTEMPVDAHMLIALSAPRPSSSPAARPIGDPIRRRFLARSCRGPVYRLARILA